MRLPAAQQRVLEAIDWGERVYYSLVPDRSVRRQVAALVRKGYAEVGIVMVRDRHPDDDFHEAQGFTLTDAGRLLLTERGPVGHREERDGR